MTKSLRRYFPEKIILAIFLTLVICFGLFAGFENYKSDLLLQQKINESKILSCEPIVSRGSRGEVYKVYLYTLFHPSGEEWKFAPRFLEQTNLKCEMEQ